jgi:adenine/guanine phosphoribosyltransferase-like PRPP-binding protein
MPTVSEIAEPLAGICTPVPYQGSGVCQWCHGHPNPGYDTCYSCGRTRWQVSNPCDRIVPVSLYEIPSQLHFILRHYKSGAVPHRHSVLELQVASILCYFLARHRQHIAQEAGGEWDLITTVPSTNRSGVHPLVRALARVPSVYATSEGLLERGTANIGHNRADDDGYQAIRRLDGERVLLVDDTFTSGARAQSAASRLTLAGAFVVSIVPIGRVINPSYGDNATWWSAQQAIGFSFAVCCLDPF